MQYRWLGVPIGSTMFTVMHTFCVHGLLYVCALRVKRPLTATRFAASLLAISALSTPCMMLAMTPCQLLQLRIDFATGAATRTAQPHLQQMPSHR